MNTCTTKGFCTTLFVPSNPALSFWLILKRNKLLLTHGVIPVCTVPWTEQSHEEKLTLELQMGGRFPEGTKQCWGGRRQEANIYHKQQWQLNLHSACLHYHMYSTKYVKDSIYYNRRTKSIGKLRENPDPSQMALCFRLRPGYGDIWVGSGFTLYRGFPSIWGKPITLPIIFLSLSRINLWPPFEVVLTACKP